MCTSQPSSSGGTVTAPAGLSSTDATWSSVTMVITVEADTGASPRMDMASAKDAAPPSTRRATRWTGTPPAPSSSWPRMLNSTPTPASLTPILPRIPYSVIPVNPSASPRTDCVCQAPASS